LEGQSHGAEHGDVPLARPLVSGAVACAAFASGALHGSAGWVALNLAVVPLVLGGLAAALRRRASRPVLAAA
jgi:hypothetical protein